MWNGAFSPTFRKSIADHFDVVNVSPDELVGIVYVTVEFHRSPNKQYVFEIPASRFDADKDAIGEEILLQLRGEA